MATSMLTFVYDLTTTSNKETHFKDLIQENLEINVSFVLHA